MLSNRPYLLRAFNQWIIDSGCTPILVIDATNPRCKIPKDFAEGGEIVFNISPIAIRDLKITNASVEFKASFSGVIHLISAPVNAILALYAEENEEGIFFDGEEGEGESTSGMVQLRSIDGSTKSEIGRIDTPPPEAAEKSKPFLRLVE